MMKKNQFLISPRSSVRKTRLSFASLIFNCPKSYGKRIIKNSSYIYTKKIATTSVGSKFDFACYNLPMENWRDALERRRVVDKIAADKNAQKKAEEDALAKKASEDEKVKSQKEVVERRTALEIKGLLLIHDVGGFDMLSDILTEDWEGNGEITLASAWNHTTKSIGHSYVTGGVGDMKLVHPTKEVVDFGFGYELKFPYELNELEMYASIRVMVNYRDMEFEFVNRYEYGKEQKLKIKEIDKVPASMSVWSGFDVPAALGDKTYWSNDYSPFSVRYVQLEKEQSKTRENLAVSLGEVCEEFNIRYKTPPEILKQIDSEKQQRKMAQEARILPVSKQKLSFWDKLRGHR